MAEQYIIYTMGNEKINKEVHRILGKSGFSWGGSGGIVGEEDKHLHCNYIAVDVGTRKVWAEVNENEYKEITFRELCELPDVHDELEELANHLFLEIDAHWKTVKHKEENQLFDFNSWCRKQNWCKVQELVEKKLGLGKE